MDLIPVQVGSESPKKWDEIEALQREAGESANQWLRDKRRPPIADRDLDWTASGFDPHWLGIDSAECSVALQPSAYHGHGADEYERFRGGAEVRGETALVISTIGTIGKQSTSETLGVRSLFDGGDSVLISQFESYINGQLLPAGGKVKIAAGLNQIDKDLALRLQNISVTLRWRKLSIEGATHENWQGRVEFPPSGVLLPLLETALGEPVAGVWLSPDGVERRYIVPVETPWPLLMEWLASRAIAEYVPGAMRRARRYLSADVDLMTRRERTARAALTALRSEYDAGELALAQEITAAEFAAASIREGLLYGTGGRLVNEVRAVLESADISVTDIDRMLGDTKNADLLCVYRDRSRLVEVKSASGSAPERAYEDLLRHLREWPHLPGTRPVDGGALILNHQHRSAPNDRDQQPYNRREFLAAVTEPIVTTLSLFDAWREEDAELIRHLVFGSGGTRELEAENSPTAPPPQTPSRRRWASRPWRKE